ncbi:cytochrome c [Pseudomonas sp. 7P_10.2_Bac1]|uniref:c-type cytochrome n=1 Tax=Pseudomonas sp. 7P_10.2_Bac1 TaxID=2971614 RepID=UPI0021C9CFD3|nr:cytochrome c [Pseudomonas sp. 7P_10.2_Bac1]MCU1726877.1 cytochrome c [Pseudomonas sp. 7P_10.2_Bac1]
MRTTMTTAVLLGLMSSAAAFASDPLILSTSDQFEEQTGEALFNQVCQGCHMAEGQGAHGAGAYPALASNPKLGAKVYPVYMVASGQGGMPGFKKYMDDQQIAAVVNYVRTHFGNQYADTVTVEEVRVLTQR